MANQRVTRYLNTDLDLVCDVDPRVLVRAFEACGLFVVVHVGDDGIFYVHCSEQNDVEPEPNIARLLNAIDRLPDLGRDLWARCSKREFNVGYECGDEPWSFNQGLSNDVLARMAECGSTFRITLYPHHDDADESVHEGESK